MGFLECFLLAFDSLRANKLRSALTLLGIVIGVSSVITMVSIGEGARYMVSSEISGLGANLLWIQADYMNEEVKKGNFQNLTLEEANRMAQLAPAVAAMSPQLMTGGQLRYQNKSEDISIGGVNEHFLDIRAIGLGRGRFIADLDVDLGRRVAVISHRMAERLFGSTDPIGQTVRIRDQQFVIIGVLEGEKSGMMVTDSTTGDNYVYVPVTVVQRMLGHSRVPVLFAQARDPRVVSDARQQLARALELIRGPNHPFEVQSQDSMVEFFGTIIAVFTAILGGIGSISLLVGGIGVMNIMLVSVTERTKEIGIRKALGAQKGDLLRQFLIESIVLCLVGGSFGIIFGQGGSQLIAVFAPWPAMISLLSIGVAVGFSTFVGIVFGVYPAYKAAQLDPIDALRYE